MKFGMDRDPDFRLRTHNAFLPMDAALTRQAHSATSDNAASEQSSFTSERKRFFKYLEQKAACASVALDHSC